MKAPDHTVESGRNGGGGGLRTEVLLDQREANEQLVLAMIRAQELAERAEIAKAAAEEAANKAAAAQAIAEEATERAEAAQRRAEATAKELARSERELRETAQFREQLLGIVGHDLRNPLTSIKMCASLLARESTLGRADTELVSRISRSAERMIRMIAQLLDFTRARLGGGLPIEPKPTDFRDVCQNAIDELEAPSAVPVLYEAQGDMTGIWDADRLVEVLSNILGNATEYATPGTPIVIKAWEAGAWVMAEVSNQGVPIPPRLLPFIFDPFRRGRQRDKSRAGNLGLGLYIAHEILRSHGGALTARCADGTTTFVLRLPRSLTA